MEIVTLDFSPPAKYESFAGVLDRASPSLYIISAYKRGKSFGVILGTELSKSFQKEFAPHRFSVHSWLPTPPRQKKKLCGAQRDATLA